MEGRGSYRVGFGIVGRSGFTCDELSARVRGPLCTATDELNAITLSEMNVEASADIDARGSTEIAEDLKKVRCQLGGLLGLSRWPTLGPTWRSQQYVSRSCEQGGCVSISQTRVGGWHSLGSPKNSSNSLLTRSRVSVSVIASR